MSAAPAEPALWRRALRRGVGVRSAPRRHRSAALLRGSAHLARWSLRASLQRRRGRPVVAIALVGHMGDLVAAEPVARYLRAEHPDAWLVWMVGRSYTPLLREHPDLDEVYAIGCVSEWIRIREGAPFDALVDLHVRGRSCGVCQIKLERSDGEPGLGIENYYRFGSLLEIFCRSAGIPVLEDAPRLHLPPGTATAVDRLGLPEGYVVVHGRSNQVSRDWRDEAWPELIRRIVSETGTPVVEVGLDPVGPPGVAGYRNLCRELALPETAEVIRRARLFVGIDSGPAHMANAAGTPGVLLLGHYNDYRRYMPYTGRYAEDGAVRLWADGPASTHSVETVWQAVAGELER